MKESSPIAPNIRVQQQPAPLTTGQRMLGNILILCPLCAWISIIVINVIRQYELGAELLWWPFPLAAEIIIDMVSTTWPVYISIIILAKLGDILEKKGVSTTGIWIPIGISISRSSVAIVQQHTCHLHTRKRRMDYFYASHLSDKHKSWAYHAQQTQNETPSMALNSEGYLHQPYIP